MNFVIMRNYNLLKNWFWIALLGITTTSVFACSGAKTATDKTEVADETQNPDPKNENMIVVDVRTQGEWDNDGHKDCSVLIPLNELESKMETLREYDKVVFVCRSGGRAGRATELLKSNGFKNDENAGPWQNAPCN